MRIVTLLLLSIMPLLVSSEEANPDPWEGFNRKMFAFNETMDRYAPKSFCHSCLRCRVSLR